MKKGVYCRDSFERLVDVKNQGGKEIARSFWLKNLVQSTEKLLYSGYLKELVKRYFEPFLVFEVTREDFSRICFKSVDFGISLLKIVRFKTCLTNQKEKIVRGSLYSGHSRTIILLKEVLG